VEDAYWFPCCETRDFFLIKKIISNDHFIMIFCL
jgi:hypothetical protein